MGRPKLYPDAASTKRAHRARQRAAEGKPALLTKEQIAAKAFEKRKQHLKGLRQWIVKHHGEFGARDFERRYAEDCHTHGIDASTGEDYWVTSEYGHPGGRHLWRLFRAH